MDPASICDRLMPDPAGGVDSDVHRFVPWAVLCREKTQENAGKITLIIRVFGIS